MTNPRKTNFGGWALASPVPVMMLLLLSVHPLQSAMCPETTLVAGHLGGAGMAVGAILSGVGLLLVGLGSLAQNNTKFAPSKKQEMRTLGRAGAIVAALSLAVWLDGLLSFYCATPAVVIVHPDPLMPSVVYKWSDVRGVSSGCAFSRGGMSVEFNLEMRDGQRIGLGGDSWSMLKPNYKLVAALLSSVPYTYDNHMSEQCPPSLREFFPRDPPETRAWLPSQGLSKTSDRPCKLPQSLPTTNRFPSESIIVT